MLSICAPIYHLPAVLMRAGELWEKKNQQPLMSPVLNCFYFVDCVEIQKRAEVITLWEREDSERSQPWALALSSLDIGMKDETSGISLSPRIWMHLDLGSVFSSNNKIRDTLVKEAIHITHHYLHSYQEIPPCIRVTVKNFLLPWTAC